MKIKRIAAIVLALSLTLSLPVEAEGIGNASTGGNPYIPRGGAKLAGLATQTPLGIAVFLGFNEVGPDNISRENPKAYREELMKTFSDTVFVEARSDKVFLVKKTKDTNYSRMNLAHYADTGSRGSYVVKDMNQLLEKSSSSGVELGTAFADAFVNNFKNDTDFTNEKWLGWLSRINYDTMLNVYSPYAVADKVSTIYQDNIGQSLEGWQETERDKRIRTMGLTPMSKDDRTYYVDAALYLDLLFQVISTLPEDARRSSFELIKAQMVKPWKTQLTLVFEAAIPAWMKYADENGKERALYVSASTIAQSASYPQYNAFQKIDGKEPNGKESTNTVLQTVYQNAFRDSGGAQQHIKNGVSRQVTSGPLGWTFGYYAFQTDQPIPKQSSGAANHSLEIYDPTNKDLPVYPNNHVVQLKSDKETIGVDIQAAVPITPTSVDLLKELEHELVDKNNIWLNVNVSRKAESNKDASRNINTPVMWYTFQKETNPKPLSQLFLATTVDGTKPLSKKVGSDFTFNVGNPTNDVKVDGAGKTWIRISLPEFKKIFYHNKTGAPFAENSLIFVDKTKDVKLTSEETVKYTYNSSVNLTYFKKKNPTDTSVPNYSQIGKATPEWVLKEIRAPQERNVSFTRSKKGTTPPSTPETKKWSTQDTLFTYSEYKHNRPFAEEYEAMAGVPTMEPMFYSIGGTPYLIELDIEKVKNKTATRYYHSYFTPVKSMYYDADQATKVEVPYPRPNLTSSDIKNAHTGGTLTYTWTGEIVNKGKDGEVVCGFGSSDTKTSTAMDIWDNSQFIADKVAADAVLAQIQAAWSGVSFTAKSDNVTRNIRWGTDTSIDYNPQEPQRPSPDVQTSTGITKTWGTPPNTYTEDQYGKPAMAKKSGNLKYTITLTVNLKAKCIDGPESERMLPQVNDRWKSTITFDYVRINNARVWRLTEGTLSGGDLRTLAGKDPVKSTIMKPDMVEYYNIAAADNAINTRLRYPTEGDVYTNFHKDQTTSTVNGYKTAAPWLDEVEINMGPRLEIPSSGDVDREGTTDQKTGWQTRRIDWLQNKPASPGLYAKNGAIYDQVAGHNGMTIPDPAVFGERGDHYVNAFNALRQTRIQPTVVSDFLVIHTDEGDIPVYYHEIMRPTSVAMGEANYGNLSEVASNDMLTTNAPWNSLAVTKLTGKYRFADVGYNGDFGNPTMKYSMPTGFKMPSFVLERDSKNPENAQKGTHTIGEYKRPTGNIYSKSEDLSNQVVPNGEYDTGHSKVKWEFLPIKATDGSARNTYSNKDKGGDATTYINRAPQSITEDSTYGVGFNKINNIVIHDPVSAQFALIESLPSNLDQRTTESKAIKFDRLSDTKQTITELNPAHPRQNFVYNGQGKFKEVQTSKFPEGWELDAGIAKINAAYSQLTLANATLKQRITLQPNKEYDYKAVTTGLQAKIDYLAPDGSVIQSTPLNGSAVRLITPENTAQAYLTFTGTGTLTSVSITPLTHDDWYPQTYSTKYKIVTPNPNYIPNPIWEIPTPIEGTLILESHGFKRAGETLQEGDYRIEMCVGEEGKSNRKVYGFTVHLKPGDEFNYETRRTLTQKEAEYERTTGLSYTVMPGRDSYLADKVFEQWDSSKVQLTGRQKFGQHSYSEFTYYSNGIKHEAVVWYNAITFRDEGNLVQVSYTERDEEVDGPGFIKMYLLDGTTTAGPGQIIDKRTEDQRTKETVEQFSSSFQMLNPPADWYRTREVTIKADTPVTTADGTFTPGNFILLDRGFRVYFPNKGDFQEDPNCWGIPTTTETKGKGWVNELDTSKWLRKKEVKFEFPVIYNGKMYQAREYIELENPKTTSWYDFYVPLAAGEFRDSFVEFRATAENAPDGYIKNMNDDERRNFGRQQGQLAAWHDSYKPFLIDVVGRIGNNSIVDTGDFRFANFFKNEKFPRTWLIANLMPDVLQNDQRSSVGDDYDIRGIQFNQQNPNTGQLSVYQNTYGNLVHEEYPLQPFPLLGEYSQVPGLRTQPMRIGYKAFMDVETIGNYGQGSVQVHPLYFAYNLETHEVEKVDVYMRVGDGKYEAINIHGNKIKEDGTYPKPIKKYLSELNWVKEHVRRLFFERPDEEPTNAGVPKYNSNEDNYTSYFGNEGVEIPSGISHYYGDAQFMNLTGKNRTFMGDTKTYGWDKNPGSTLANTLYTFNGHRWHYTLGLPSSAAFVEAGKAYTDENAKRYTDGKWVILLGIQQYALGSTFHLKGDVNNRNNVPISVRKKDGSIHKIPMDLTKIPNAKIVIVFTPNKSSKDDLDVHGIN